LLRVKNETHEQSNTHQKLVEEFARENNKDVVVLIGNEMGSSSNYFQDLLGVTQDTLPQIRFLQSNLDGLKKFKFEESPTTENLKYFIERIRSRNVEPYVHSQKVPRNNNGDVRTVVGTTFAAEVLNTDKDVLVNFYANWDSESGKLFKKYKAVAKNLKLNTNLILARVDNSKNEIMGQYVENYPTLFLYRGEDKLNPIKFRGNNTEEDVT
jgi:hypothetical protein